MAKSSDSPQRVPITQHLEALQKRDLHHAAELRKTDQRHAKELRKADQLAVKAALAAAEKAVETAKVASDEHLKANNNVLEGWKEDRGNFVTRQTREEDQAANDARFKRTEGLLLKAVGGMVVLGAIGLGNLVKLWLA